MKLEGPGGQFWWKDGAPMLTALILLNLVPSAVVAAEQEQHPAPQVEQKPEVLVEPNHSDPIIGVALSADGRTVLSAGLGNALVWDLASGRRLREFGGHLKHESFNSVAFSPDGRTALFGSSDHTLQLWDVASGRELRTFSGHSGSVSSVAFSPDGRAALSSSWDHTLKLWDVASGRELRTFSGHSDAVRAAAFSPDGRKVLSASDDQTLRLWDVATARELRAFSGVKYAVETVSFSPDGLTALTGSVYLKDTTVDLWDVATGRKIRAFSQYTAPLAFSPDDSTAVSASWGTDFKLEMWDIHTGLLLHTLSGYTNQVFSVVFSPDGRFILSGGSDGVIRVWSASSGKELLQLISFTDAEWVAITPDGYYNASPKGDQYINVRIGTNVYGVDQWRSKFYRPDVVEAVLHLGDTGAALSATLGTTGPAPMIEPPFVAIKSPDDGAKLNSLSTEIALIVEDRHLAIRSVKVLVNGRTAAATGERRISPLGPALDFPAGQNQLLLHVPVTLDPGENRIEVAASNGVSEGRQTLRILAGQSVSAADQADILPNLWILGIAVNRYDSRDIQSLSYAVADVHGIAAAFTAQKGRLFREVHTLILADDGDLKPTRDNIIDNLRFLKKAGQNDVALLIISGHGENDDSGNYFFLPSDAALQEDRLSIRPSHAVSWRDLKSVLEVPAKKIVLLDTCHAEGISGKSAEKRRGVQTTDTNRLVKELQDFGAVVFASSRGAESSVESDKWGHGAFTYALLKGLNGEANLMHRDVITMKELDAYVSETVPTLTGGTQHPITYTPDGYVDFPVAKLK